ncbi:MAG: hypothetical protein ACRDSP_18415 [Pseudonocardiaceae bacterium]
MLAEARDRAARKREERLGLVALFDIDTEAQQLPVDSFAWEPTTCWDPTSRPWWSAGS